MLVSGFCYFRAWMQAQREKSAPVRAGRKCLETQILVEKINYPTKEPYWKGTWNSKPQINQTDAPTF